MGRGDCSRLITSSQPIQSFDWSLKAAFVSPTQTSTLDFVRGEAEKCYNLSLQVTNTKLFSFVDVSVRLLYEMSIL